MPDTRPGFPAVTLHRFGLGRCLYMAGTVGEIMGLLYSAQQGGLTGQQESMDAIQHAIERMQADLAVPIDLPRLAQDLGVSYSWLRRTFAEHTGLAPHQYWLELRLVRARNLLSQTSLTVKEAARKVGFEDEHYFCRLFRKKTGSGISIVLTPTMNRTKGCT